MAKLTGGFFSGLFAHEMGHIMVLESQGTSHGWDGVSIMYETDELSSGQHLQAAFGGMQALWLVSEAALTIGDESQTGDFGAGVVLSHVATAAAYLTFLRTHPEGDIYGMSEATSTSRGWIAAGLALPAIFDAWRLFDDDPPPWLPNVARFSKGVGLVFVWSY